MLDHQGQPCRVKVLGNWRHIDRARQSGRGVVSFNAELVADDPNH
jgi:hypothetical protein